MDPSHIYFKKKIDIDQDNVNFFDLFSNSKKMKIEKKIKIKKKSKLIHFRVS